MNEGKQLEKKQVVMLPTRETSPILLNSDGKLEYDHILSTYGGVTQQHLYVTDDSEIKEGDWYIHHNTHHNTYELVKADDEFDDGNNPNIVDRRSFVYFCINRKVIATTNPELWYTNELTEKGKHYSRGMRVEDYPINARDLQWFQASNVSRIPKDFIEAYIREYNAGKPIAEIMVEMTNSVTYNPSNNMLENKLKLRPDGTIYCHPVKEEVIQIPVSLGIELHIDSNGKFYLTMHGKRVFTEADIQAAYKEGAYQGNISFGPSRLEGEYKKWLSENYPQ